MTDRYVWVSWNRHKRVYDAVVVGAVALYLAVFVGASFAFSADEPDMMVVLMRATGSLAIVMLHVILCIGPLARLSDRVAPVLYNRRHLGVMMFMVALVHAGLVLLYYGGFGGSDPVSAVLLSGRSFSSLGAFPYELLGFGALVILFVMAATSHDFWLEMLSPAVWKAMHMGVYVAYALAVGHVALGSLMDDPWSVRGGLLVAGVAIVGGLHVATGLRELARDTTGWKPTPEDAQAAGPDGERVTDWLEVGSVDDIPEGRAKVVCLADRERVAVFKYDGKVSAVSNVCAHQAGPLGEGKVVDGCVTCPWHGYQYRPQDGCSPPPYTEKVPTYRVKVHGRTVLLDPRALPAGTAVEPAFFEAAPDDEVLFEDTDHVTVEPGLPPAPGTSPGKMGGGDGR